MATGSQWLSRLDGYTRVIWIGIEGVVMSEDGRAGCKCESHEEDEELAEKQEGRTTAWKREKKDGREAWKLHCGLQQTADGVLASQQPKNKRQRKSYFSSVLLLFQQQIRTKN